MTDWGFYEYHLPAEGFTIIGFSGENRSVVFYRVDFLLNNRATYEIYRSTSKTIEEIPTTEITISPSTLENKLSEMKKGKSREIDFKKYLESQKPN